MKVKASKFRLISIYFTILYVLAGCGRIVTECGGTPLDIGQLNQIRAQAFSSGSRAFLITPNPLDASGNVNLQAFDSSIGSLFDPYSLIGLKIPSRLENDFLKVRISNITDSLAALASPNSKGEYSFPLTDIHYGETMAYHSLTAIDSYVQALGFQTDRSRPFYAMVRAEGSTTNPEDVNAYYNHNSLTSNAPRELKVFGDTAHSAWQEQDIFWHEYGHYFLESITGSRGVDYAGDSGAIFTEGAAVHECFADYGAESLSGRGYLGRWIAQNFSGYSPGQPLRVAYDQNDEFGSFQKVSEFDPMGKNLDRYRLSQWCSRVLWDIREQMVTENDEQGQYYADRTIFAAASLLQKNTSISDFKNALLVADEELNCGIHSRSITNAFVSRGFKDSVPKLTQPLFFEGSIVWLSSSSTTSKSFALQFIIKNTNSQIARNVRLVLEAPNGGFISFIPQQSFGDLGAGKTISVGANSALPLDYSVLGVVLLNKNYQGTRVLIRVQMENGPESVHEVAL